ncbi:MAG: PAAR domain-containing protein, partial [Bacteroidota bacterium]
YLKSLHDSVTKRHHVITDSTFALYANGGAVILKSNGDIELIGDMQFLMADETVSLDAKYIYYNAGNLEANVNAASSFNVNNGLNIVGSGITSLSGATILAANLPAATIGSIHTTACTPGSIVTGSNNVLINNIPAARLGDVTNFGGTILNGNPNILINSIPAARLTDQVTDPRVVNQMPCVGGPIVSNTSPTVFF